MPWGWGRGRGRGGRGRGWYWWMYPWAMVNQQSTVNNVHQEKAQNGQGTNNQQYTSTPSFYMPPWGMGYRGGRGPYGFGMRRLQYALSLGLSWEEALERANFPIGPCGEAMYRAYKQMTGKTNSK